MDKFNFKKIVSSSIFGDGYFYKVAQSNKKQNTHYMLKQLSSHRDYVEWLVSVLEELTRVHVVVQEGYQDSRGYYSKEQLIVKTMRHPIYKEMYNRLYTQVGNTHVKRLDPHYLKMIDWQSLAMMYMDDGNKKQIINKHKESWVSCIINTHKFSYAEVKMLRDYIAEKFNVHFNVLHHTQKSGSVRYYMSANKDNSSRFIDGISDFIFPSFEYKIKVTPG